MEKMKSITVHGIEPPLAELIKSRAFSEGLSINKTVKKILEEALGIKPANSDRHRDDFKAFCGVWTRADQKEFESNTQSLNAVDQEDWQ